MTLSIDDIDDILPVLEGTDKIFNIMGRYPDFDQKLIGLVESIKRQVRSGMHGPSEFGALDFLLHDMRLFKSREVRMMRKAAAINVGHERAMRLCKPGLHEYQITAEFDHEYRRNNADHAYNPIVVVVPTAVSCITTKTAINCRMVIYC